MSDFNEEKDVKKKDVFFDRAYRAVKNITDKHPKCIEDLKKIENIKNMSIEEIINMRDSILIQQKKLDPGGELFEILNHIINALDERVDVLYAQMQKELTRAEKVLESIPRILSGEGKK